MVKIELNRGRKRNTVNMMIVMIIVMMMMMMMMMVMIMMMNTVTHHHKSLTDQPHIPSTSPSTSTTKPPNLSIVPSL